MSRILYINRVVAAVAGLTLLLTVWPAGDLHAQPLSRSVLDDPFVREVGVRGLESLYNLRFEESAEAFAEIDRRYPDHPIGPFLRSLTTWWEILLDLQNPARDDEFFDMMDHVIERCDRMLAADETNVDAIFFKGAALGFRGRLRSNRRQWFRAAMDGKGAMDYVLAVAELDSANADYVFGKGIYDYFAEAIPRRYAVVKPLMAFFPDGDRERGLMTLERTARDGFFVRTEATYFLFQISYIYERDFSASIRYIQLLRDRYPGNSLFRTLEGRVNVSWARWEEAREIFESVLSEYLAGTPGYTDAIAEQALYYVARTEMAEHEFETALGYLLQLEALAARSDEDTHFKVLGRLRQGMAHDALGHREVAEDRYREVLDMDDASGAHRRARQYLETPYRSGVR